MVWNLSSISIRKNCKSIWEREALDLILSSETPDDEDLEDERFLEVYQEATDLYGLIHARFIMTGKGTKISII